MKRAYLKGRGNVNRATRTRERESDRWKPGEWTPEKKEEFTLHTLKYAVRGLCEFLGPYFGNIISAQLRAKLMGEMSKTMLAALGQKTIGES